MEIRPPIERSDWRKAGLYTVAFAVSSVGAPNIVLRDKNSPYAFKAVRGIGLPAADDWISEQIDVAIEAQANEPPSIGSKRRRRKTDE